MKTRRRRVAQLLGLLALGALVYAGVRYLPFGLTDPERYFDPPETRRLQPDEAGQLKDVLDEYRVLREQYGWPSRNMGEAARAARVQA